LHRRRITVGVESTHEQVLQLWLTSGIDVRHATVAECMVRLRHLSSPIWRFGWWEVRLRSKYVALLLVAAVLMVVAVLLYPLFYDKLEEIRVHVPEYQRPAEVVTLDQNWTAAQRTRFHHTPQGTRLVPYEWFKALEQPCLSLTGCGMFVDPGYLDRFGFIPSQACFGEYRYLVAEVALQFLHVGTVQGLPAAQVRPPLRDLLLERLIGESRHTVHAAIQMPRRVPSTVFHCSRWAASCARPSFVIR
jgi:hypothetical protein